MSELALFVFALMQFFARSHDRGRSNQSGGSQVLIASLAIFGVDYIGTALAPLRLCGCRSGVFFSGVAGPPLRPPNAYIATSVHPDKRATNSLVGTALSHRFIIGRRLGCCSAVQSSRSRYVSAGITFCNTLSIFGEGITAKGRPSPVRTGAQTLGALLALHRSTMLGFLA